MKEIRNWEDFDREYRRRMENIRKMERNIMKARENLANWASEICEYLRSTIGPRKRGDTY